MISWGPMKSTLSIYKGRLSTRGRMTIPAALRRRYGLRGGSRLALEVTPTGGFILTPLPVKRR